ncbi:MAG TPA: thermonuclease family protein [Acidimicrobiia bacterium]|nr:thermonuclease family protein [Acidimicrobiia bacterium]
MRIIGVDTPEEGDCLYAEATAFLSSIISGRSVRLIVDQSDRDQFDRLLRYVIVNGVFVNAALVREGLATAVQFRPVTFMASILEAAQGEAQAAGRGTWGRMKSVFRSHHPLVATPPIQPYAFHRNRLTSTAVRSRSPTSRLSHPTRTGLMAMVTVLGVRHRAAEV